MKLELKRVQSESPNRTYNLKELILILWKSKLLICVITGTFAVFSIVVNWFVLNPTYEASSMIRFNTIEGDGGNTINLHSYAEIVQTDVFANRLIKKLDLSADEFKNLSAMFKVGALSNSNIIQISIEGGNTSQITKIVNMAALELSARVEISDRSSIIVKSNEELKKLRESIMLMKEEEAAIEAQLAKTPEKLINKKVLGDDLLLSRGSSSERLELVTEETNPVFVNLSSKLSEQRVHLSRIIEEEKVVSQRIQMNEALIKELDEKVADDEVLASTSSILQLTGMKSIVVSPAIEPTSPIAPKKVTNVALAVIAGGMFSLIVVFFRNYWRNS